MLEKMFDGGDVFTGLPLIFTIFTTSALRGCFDESMFSIENEFNGETAVAGKKCARFMAAAAAAARSLANCNGDVVVVG